METDNLETEQVPKTDETIVIKTEVPSTHALGLQELYKAAFSQGTVSNFNDSTVISTANLVEEIPEKYYTEIEKLESHLDQQVTTPSQNFNDSYQLYTLKGLQYSAPQIDLSQLSYEIAPKPENGEETEVLTTATVLNENFHQNDGNSVLDMDKGIQIHLVKSEGAPTIPTTEYSYETCEYTGDAQILHRYLSDSSFIKSETENQPIGTVTVNFVNKQNMPEKSFYDSDSVGVNPETLGVRFEDCDFNSSDSFASTESIIPKNIKCPKCPKKFMFKSDLLRHDKYKHSVKPKLFCKFCSKEFVNQQNLLFHEKSHKKKRNSYKCDVCKKVFKKSAILVKHMMKKHSKTLPFTCSQCSKVFGSQVLLNNHFRKVHMSDNEKPFKCEICSKSFEKKQGLSCHLKSHMEDQPYVCQQCNKSFSKLWYLKNHLKSHASEEKDSFVCDTCGKDFKSSSALEEHSRKHTGEKPFTCNVCMKSIASKSYFKVHIKKHGDVKPFTCTYCQKSFVTGSELNKHEKTHTKDKSFQCTNCHQEFSQQSSLAAHIKKQKCNGIILNKSQEVCTQTTEFVTTEPVPGGTLHNASTLTLQNVNVIVDETFTNQQPIVLTSLGSFINSNTVPVILTQNPSVPYSVSSIT